MLAPLPERHMHRLRWVLTIGWLLVIASLFYDPWTARLTEPTHPWSPLRLSGECVQVQGSCLVEQPYPIGATLFWGAIVPSGILILLVLGHEVWRRICPLSFLSQIPRALGWQRQIRHENPKTGKVRYELTKVKADSWLGRNYPYLQFGWLFVGLCGRILFFNADRLVLGCWLLFTIGAAIAVGYLYGGKSWCQYFCPMAPVQTIFSQPRGLLGSKAHMSEQRITQSMCRTVLPEGGEQSACVACQSPCFDIDSERTYWDGLNRPEEALIRYGYVGLVVGYFVYYYLYAGNWDYYFSGIWNRDPNQLAALMNPGLYWFGQPIGIPKLLAVPLVLGGFTAIGYLVGCWIEGRVKSAYSHHPDRDHLIRHRIFAICTFSIFNFFFFFAGRPLLQLMPLWVQYGFDVSIVFLSTLWLQKTWRCHPQLYARENLASRFRKQLEKQLDVSHYLEGRSLADLQANELYVLAKVLPGFTRQKRHEVYKSVVREALEEGYVNSASSLSVLQQMRQELSMSDDEHREVLEELGIEDPDLLNPSRQRSLENQVRLSGYQNSLERLLRLQQKQSDLATVERSPQDATTIGALRREYAVTPQEESWLFNQVAFDAGITQKAEVLLSQLEAWVVCDRALSHLELSAHQPVFKLLRTSVRRKQDLIVQAILATLSKTTDQTSANAIARSLKQLLPTVVAASVKREPWTTHLSADLVQRLGQAERRSDVFDAAPTATASDLEILLQHYDPLVQATTLYLLAQLNPDRAQAIAAELAHSSTVLVQSTAKQLLSLPPAPPLKALPMLEKLIHLFNSRFFHHTQTETLVALSDRAEIRTYGAQDVITAAGDTCRELLLLIEGNAKIHYQLLDEVRVEQVQPGQMLDELEVLTDRNAENTILAESEQTRILAIPVDSFDDLLDRDPDLTKRILELESRQLQRLVRSGQK